MKKIFILSWLMVWIPLASGAARGGDIAIIVNKEIPLREVSSSDLIKIFKQEKQHWDDGGKIYVIMQEAGSPEKERVLKRIFKMGDEELKKFWLAKMFRGEISSFPRTLSSNEAVRRFVGRVPDTIGFVDLSFIDESVAVLRIDGKLPGEKGYLLGEH